MKSRFLLWGSALTACLSGAWVLLLATLVLRCKLSDHAFPVLAKFSPFKEHMNLTDQMLQGFPILALLSVALLGIAWYRERLFQAVRLVALILGANCLMSCLVIAVNPGGYISWFLS